MPQPESPTARRVIAALSVTVVVAVAVVLYLFPRQLRPGGQGPDALATVNAGLNAGSAVCLVLGFAAIKAKRVGVHRALMLSSFVLSSVFLVTYLVHHARVGSVKFEGAGWLRPAYLAVLLPHVVLAVTIVPLALLTIRRGWIGDVERHRSIARRTLPLWLYVSASGVLLYFMLYHGR